MSGNNPSQDETIIDEAARWHVASASDDMDWDGFSLWLEADPRHRARFDEVALSDALIGEYASVLQNTMIAAALPQEAPSTRRNWWAIGAVGAVAAAFVALLATPALMRSPEAMYATGATARVVALADGSTITLAPRSRLVIPANGDADMRLTGGAFFAVRHNPARQLAIAMGPLEIRDIGTSFDVQSNGDVVRVAVAEGEVEAASALLAQPIHLTRGRALLFDADHGVAELAAADVDGVGGWRQGHLSYQNMPLALVAADLGRYAGIHLDVANLGDRRFSGTLAIANAKSAPRDLAQIMGLALVRGPHGTVLATGVH